jgi:hypothetical protein
VHTSRTTIDPTWVSPLQQSGEPLGVLWLHSTRYKSGAFEVIESAVAGTRSEVIYQPVNIVDIEYLETGLVEWDFRELF